MVYEREYIVILYIIIIYMLFDLGNMFVFTYGCLLKYSSNMLVYLYACIGI